MTEADTMELARLNGLLKKKVLHWLPEPGTLLTDVPGLNLVRRERVNLSENCFTRPCVSVIIQGSKRSVMGSEEYVYGENQCLVVGVDMPSSFCVIAGSPDQPPFLSMSLALDKALITGLAAEIPFSDAPPESEKGVSIADAEPDVLNAFLRLIELLEKPRQIPILAPMIIRELHYLLLIGPQGGILRKFNTQGTRSNQIARAIAWLRENYKEPLRVEALAQSVNMALLTFHRHFKEVTSLSPLQFHKRLRLYEAQRLMLTENRDATSAGLAVGYESPTQFNREYKRLFGEPPRRNVMRFR